MLAEMKEQRKTDTGEETPDTLEEVFQKIQEMTGENDLEMLVTNFIQGEFVWSFVQIKHLNLS